MLKKLQVGMASYRRETANGWGYASMWFAQRFYYRYIKRHVNDNSPTTSDRDRELTVVIPAAEKDAQALMHCLKSARGLIRHRLAGILVIAPESDVLRQITGEAGETFILEDVFLPRAASELNCRGWLLQQFIKFNAAFHVPTMDYLVLDADTVFLRPQTFFRSNKTILRYSDQYELLYNRSLQMTFGHRKRFPVSFVTHHMIFNVDLVKNLLSFVEHRHKQPWYEYILTDVDGAHQHLISFSEYETYGNFVVSQPGWRKQFQTEYWNGEDSCADDLPRLSQLQHRVPQAISSISFHQHTQ
jgi:hypothetical protein